MNKWVVTLVFLVGFALIGCSSHEMKGNKPPKAEIQVASNSYGTILGTYCWKTECVDTVGPEEILQGQEPIKVKPGENITFVMNYEPKPNKFHVLQIGENKEVGINVKDNRFEAPMQAGIYYYSYGVWWTDDKRENVSRGDAFYNFVI